jgi:hypothetical protein
MKSGKFALLAVGIVSMCAELEARADPVPGDVFREYMWYNKDGDAGQALRVGGKHGQEHPDRGWAHNYINAPVRLEHDLDLQWAVKAEIVIEKILCHDGTRGLAIQVNGRDWLEVPEAKTIPYPQWDYQHHSYPVVSIPLSHLKQGVGNEFRMRVSPEHPWKWPQNLIYGVHFRIYYDVAKKPHPTGDILTPTSGETIGRSVILTARAERPNGKIKQVDYIGFYEDVNFEGDGVYRQWHYHFFHGQIMHHIGSATVAPYRVTWDTSWVPDQSEPVLIAARIVDDTGMTFVTEAVGGLELVRPGLSVELCKPYHVPKSWVTRKGRQQEHFDVTGDLEKAVAAQLVWASWSPGYMNGIYINGQKVFDNEGPKYDYFAHRVALDDMSAFKQGQNTLATGRSKPNAHGMEVNWPGIMVLIRYSDRQDTEH